jgi:starch synthase
MAIRRIKNVCFVTREYNGLAGAGGIKDVCRQLAEALTHNSHPKTNPQTINVSVILPCYGFIDPQLLGFTNRGSFSVSMNYTDRDRLEKITIWGKTTQGKDQGSVTIFLLDSTRFKEKMGIYSYTPEEEKINPFNRADQGHYDYFAMNVLLQKGALASLIYRNQRPDIIHCHDGHTALIPAMAREIDGFRHFFKRTGFLTTIHNAGIGYHQEIADLAFAQAITGLPQSFINKNLLDGKFDPFIVAASHGILNTVSENYARELRETNDDALTGWLGHFLMSRGIKIHGITNGINPDDFDTETPKKLNIPMAYSVKKGDLKGKTVCRQYLTDTLQQNNLSKVSQYGSLDHLENSPLLTSIGRFSSQKGMDKLTQALQLLLPVDKNVQVLILGSGDPQIAQGLISLTRESKYAGRICILQGYDPILANQIYAAGDFFVIPSEFEPCGLTDFMAQLYGNLPIVHEIGGLVKVLHNKTGFSYKEHSAAALLKTIKYSLTVYRKKPEMIRKMQQQAIQIIEQKYTWAKVKEQYLQLYREALCKK